MNGDPIVINAGHAALKRMQLLVEHRLALSPGEGFGPSGAGWQNFVFVAKKPGKYRIEVIPIYEGKKREPVKFDVVVK